jgi:hypothetical protein
MIWFNLIIPIIAIVVMLVFFKKKIAIWEYALIFFIPIIAIIVGKYSSIHSQTTDTEYWNFHLVRAQYNEYWSTWDEQTCTREVACGTDADGNTKYCTEEYDCSECLEHSPSWIAYDNGGNSHSINQAMFEQLCKTWNNRSFKDLHRSINKHWNCGVDGDAYVTTWDKNFETSQPVCLLKTYENKTQCSKTIFNFSEVDSSDSAFYGLLRYPYYERMGKFNYNPIIGYHDPVASQRLSRHNGMLGAWKKVHMMIAVYKNQPQKSALMQEALWKRGNKNEFILCIGIDNDKKIDWTYVISWSNKEKLKIDVRDSVANMDFNLSKISDYMADEVEKRFEKKSFEDFSYINVEPTMTAVFVTFIIVILLTVGLCIFSVMNDQDIGSSFRRKR